MTKEKWLGIVKDNEKDLTSLILDWHPASRRINRRHKQAVVVDNDVIEIDRPSLRITAPNAERAAGVVREVIAKEDAAKAMPVDRFKAALEAGDVAEINSLLNAAWFGAPESVDCWSLPGFSVAVDLMDDLPEEEVVEAVGA